MKSTSRNSYGAINPWPLGIILFFLVLFAVNGVFVYLAVDTHTGSVSEEPYADGLKYQQTIDLLEKSKELGWSTDLQISQRTKEGLHFFKILLRDQDGIAIEDLKLTLSVLPLTQEGFAQEVPLNIKDQAYFGEAVIKSPGLAALELKALENEAPVYLWKTRRVLD